MDITELLKNIGILTGITVGIIGGIPKIKAWLKPKPHLVIRFINFIQQVDDGLKPTGRYDLTVALCNVSRFLRRSGKATNVKAECHVIDMNRDQRGGLNVFPLSTKLPIGEGVNKNFVFTPECNREFNPHALILNISCDEGQKLDYEIPFDCL